MPLNTTSELLSDLKKGKMVVLMDDEDRENEGDLILPAENVSLLRPSILWQCMEEVSFVLH